MEMTYIYFMFFMLFAAVLYRYKNDDRAVTYAGLIILVLAIFLSKKGIDEVSILSILIISVPVLITSSSKGEEKGRLHNTIKLGLVVFLIVSSTLMIFLKKNIIETLPINFFNDHDKSYLLICVLFLLASLLFEVKGIREGRKK